jgi:curved DNA-binding protein CbpA
MKGLLIVLVILLIICLFKAVSWEKDRKRKTAKHIGNTTRHTTTVTQSAVAPIVQIQITNSSNQNEEKYPPIRQDNNGCWILNPGAPFELTLIGGDQKVAQEIRYLLDNDEIRYHRQSDKLITLFATYNLKIKEIEEYKDKYRQIYLTKIEELVKNSNEWEILGKKDKEDLLTDFRYEAAQTIYERADCNLEILFEWDIKNITIDDELIKEYGFDNIHTYSIYAADNLNKIHVAPKDSYSRLKFEEFAEIGLATRGNELSKKEILSTLTLKTLNAIAANPDKEYKRKNQAIEYILYNDNDFEQKIGEFVSLRELFKLKPLPEKYSSLNLNDIIKIWDYYSEESGMLIRTYYQSFYSWRDLKNTDFVTGYTVSPFNKENPCPCAERRASIKYPKNNPPKVPCHIGCNCYLHKEYTSDNENR